MKRGFLDGYKTYDPSDGYGSPEDWRDAFYERMGMDEADRILRDRPETPESILGVAPNASAAQVKAAFRKLIKEWHPDHNAHRLEEATEQTKRIIAAFTKLSARHAG